MLLPFHQALERLSQAVIPLAVERASLDDCDGRVLRHQLLASLDLPAFDHSAMDGYALHSTWCSGPGPWSLAVTGESRAGQPLAALAGQAACRIFTGAQLPSGANCVLLQENVEREGDQIRFSHHPQELEHVRRAGADIRRGSLAIAAGTRLHPGHVGLLASLDHAFVTVASRARVTLVSTGDELRLPSTVGAPGSIAESNSFTLAALCRRLGASVRVLPHVADTPEATTTALEQALQTSDLVITVGGASVGDHDLVRPTLSRCGVD